MVEFKPATMNVVRRTGSLVFYDKEVVILRSYNPAKAAYQSIMATSAFSEEVSANGKTIYNLNSRHSTLVHTSRYPNSVLARYSRTVGRLLPQFRMEMDSMGGERCPSNFRETMETSPHKSRNIGRHSGPEIGFPQDS